jgi:hypothetical protein
LSGIQFPIQISVVAQFFACVLVKFCPNKKSALALTCKLVTSDPRICFFLKCRWKRIQGRGRGFSKSSPIFVIFPLLIYFIKVPPRFVAVILEGIKEGKSKFPKLSRNSISLNQSLSVSVLFLVFCSGTCETFYFFFFSESSVHQNFCQYWFATLFNIPFVSCCPVCFLYMASDSVFTIFRSFESNLCSRKLRMWLRMDL